MTHKIIYDKIRLDFRKGGQSVEILDIIEKVAVTLAAIATIAKIIKDW